MRKVLIYGTGKVAKYIITNHVFNDEIVVGVVETKKSMDIYMGGVYSILNK